MQVLPKPRALGCSELDDGMGIVPPRLELRRLAGDRRHRRFGQDMRDAVALERVQRGTQGAPSIGDVPQDSRCAGARNAVGDGAAGRGQCGAAPGAAEIDAELLDDVAPDLDDRDLQHHLVLPADHERVDDVTRHDHGRAGRDGDAAAAAAAGRALPGAHRGVAGIGARDVEGALGVDRGRYGTGQDHRIVDGLNVDVVVRHHGLEDAFERADVAIVDVDRQRRDRTPGLIEGEDRGRPLGQRHHVEAAGRAHHGIGDAGVADEDFRSIFGKIDDRGLADRHREPLRAGVRRHAQDVGRGCRGAVWGARHENGLLGRGRSCRRHRRDGGCKHRRRAERRPHRAAALAWARRARGWFAGHGVPSSVTLP